MDQQKPKPEDLLEKIQSDMFSLQLIGELGGEGWEGCGDEGIGDGGVNEYDCSEHPPFPTPLQPTSLSTPSPLCLAHRRASLCHFER